MNLDELKPPLSGLIRHEDPRRKGRWTEGEPDYVEELGLTPEHIPDLIAISRLWLVPDTLPEGDALFAPIFAWRALGQLGTIEAVDPLLSMLNDLDDRGDDWYLEEYPDVFGLIGAEAIPRLEAYLTEAQNLEYPRIVAAHCLRQIAMRHPDTRDQVVAILTRQLELFEENDYDLNAFLVNYLVDLRASESAETMERAYAADRVDEDVLGSWGDVRHKLGVEGMGLAPDERRHPFLSFARRPERVPPRRHATPAAAQTKSKAKKKQKRKSQKAARRKNRRR